MTSSVQPDAGVLGSLSEDVQVFNATANQLLQGYRDAEERAKEKRKKQREKVAAFFNVGASKKVDTDATPGQGDTEEIEMSTLSSSTEVQPTTGLRKVANSTFLVGLCPALAGEVSECEELLLNVQGDADDVGLVMAGTEDLIAAAPSSLVNQNYSTDAEIGYVGLVSSDHSNCNTVLFLRSEKACEDVKAVLRASERCSKLVQPLVPGPKISHDFFTDLFRAHWLGDTELIIIIALVATAVLFLMVALGMLLYFKFA